MTTAKPQPRDLTPGFNRVMYGLMIALSLYYILFNKDVATAMSTLGIGLIFDPFRQEVPWAQRPLYQKAVLLVHLLLIFALLAILAFNHFTK